MNYVLDTNIILLSLVNSAFAIDFRNTYQPLVNKMILSAVSEGELKSLAIQRKWGIRRKDDLNNALADYLIYPVKVQAVIDMYAEIDAYSQGKLPDKSLPYGMSARNMGKNDIWIASVAAVTGSKLITTDKDFQHLDGVFLDLIWIDISAYF